MPDYSEIYKALKNINGVKATRKASLCDHTTFRIGGPAEILVIPRDTEALKEILNISRGIRKYVLGNGSNVLMPDKGLRGLVIKISKGLNGFTCDGRIVTVGAGMLIQPLLQRLMSLGLSGLEFSAWVPAAVGGAVTMNMGAFGQDIGGLIEYVDVMDRSGNVEKLSGADLSFSYRKSNISDRIVISVAMKLSYRKKDSIRKTMDEIILKRKEMQPMSVPSAGSIFKNPKDVPAGKLIDMAGCKGLRIGGAEVSKKHANFIINLGDAKSTDVKALIRKVRATVKEKFKVKLELELVDSSELNMLF